MKMIAIMAALAAFTLGQPALAQSKAQAASGSASQSASQAAAGSASSSALRVTNNYGTDRQTLTYDGDYSVKTVPSVTPPAVFGGGHPCLAGKSGGLSVIGGGFSYGQGDPEPACMAYIMGQPEVAIRIMANTNADFCRAMNAVGYYRVGNTVVPFKCGENRVIGGAQTPGVSTRPVKLSTRNGPSETVRTVSTASGGDR